MFAAKTLAAQTFRNKNTDLVNFGSSYVMLSWHPRLIGTQWAFSQ